MTEVQPLFHILTVPVYGYGICVAFAVLAGILLSAWCFHLTGLTMDGALTLGLLAVPMGLIGARLVYCLVNVQYIFVDVGADVIPRFWTGGYALFGAVPGVALAAALYAKRIKAKPGKILDGIAPACALVLCICRAGEAFTTQGLGDYILDEGLLQSFPFAVQNLYGDYQLAVFLYEAFAALIICIATWVMLARKKAPAGRVSLYFLLHLGLTQIFLESLREDEFLRFGFVRFNQIMSIASIVLAAIILAKGHKVHWRVSHTLRCILLGTCIPLLIAIEFALDKSSLSVGFLYALMALILLGMLILIRSMDVHAKPNTSSAASITHEIDNETAQTD